MNWLAAVVLVGALAATGARAGDGPEQAQALVTEALELYRTAGPEQAFATMNEPDGGFRHGSLYIFVLDPANITVVHAADPSRVGNDATTVTDADGQSIGLLLREGARPEGSWVHYRFTNYENGAVEDKTSWVVLEDGYVFGAGYYGPPQ